MEIQKRSNVSAVDTMLFEYRKLWWLTFNLEIGADKNCSSLLMAFYSENPLSNNWKEHKLNPLVFDSRIGRNGGILNVHNNFPIRVRQRQGFNLYGSSMSLAKINKLTPNSFEEKEMLKITPSFFKNAIGTHHMHSNNDYTVYDFFSKK
jgi:hypothetical protein|tara:strand:- start:459 stop:905 length:447 start_codon:yes stop_codon:yes gene_type:complete